MTNIYVVQAVAAGGGGDSTGSSDDNAAAVSTVQAETYTAWFAAGGFRFAQVSGLPADHNLTPDQLHGLVTQLQINSRVASSCTLVLPPVPSPPAPSVSASEGTLSLFPPTEDVLNRIHAMTRQSQQSNLWTCVRASSKRNTVVGGVGGSGGMHVGEVNGGGSGGMHIGELNGGGSGGGGVSRSAAVAVAVVPAAPLLRLR